MAARVRKLSGNIVDLFERRIFPGTIEWSGGKIRRVTPLRGERFPHYIAPGFVDAHIHIESSMLPPAEFARLAVVHGTVATVSDPHEIANVLGVAGVDTMIREARRSPLKFNFGAPSCVPATTFESAGATLGPRAVAKLLARPEIKFLSEVMNFPGVLQRAPGLMAMIAAAQKNKKPVDGHAPGLRGKEAAAYAAAGITTDHECFTLAEAKDKLAAGMKILIREGSAAKNFAALAPLLKTDAANCMFCCDDKHPDELLKHHIDEHVRRSLATGADRLDVLRCASLNPVEHYGLDVGLLRPGDAADFIVFEGWEKLRVRQTYLRGELVARDGKSLLPRKKAQTPNAFRARPRTAADFAVKAPSASPRTTLNVIESIDGQLISKFRRVKVRASDGELCADPSRDLLKIAVVNRYAARAPVAVAFIRGFGLREGALASSVAHDSHNIVAVGTSDEALAEAVNLIIRHRGGVCAVGGGESRVLPLPIAGLMSNDDGRRVAAGYEAVDALAKKLGSGLHAPFMTLSFMALLVIPDLKLSDKGLFSAKRWGFVPVAE